MAEITKWNPDAVLKLAERQARIKLELAAEALASEVVRNISEPGPEPSKPGEFPHAQTGLLRQSIFWKVVDFGGELFAVIGSPLKYALHLEIGTSKMAARPFLRRTLYQMAGKLKSIFGR